MDHQQFSVAISVYKNDNPVFFDRALESITDKQTIKPDEIVLVVDGPVTEKINEVIKKYENKYAFNTIRLEKNGGLGNALKLASENSRFDLVARMDSDDVSISNRFEQQLSFLKNNPDVDIVGGDITEFVGNEENIVAKRSVPKTNDDIRRYMKKRCAMNHVSVMFKKQSIMNAGGYQDWYCNEDYYLWIRMWLNGAVFSNMGTVLVNVRTGKDMYSRRGGKNYYESEKKLQKFMLNNGMIGRMTFFANCLNRFVVQRMLPNSIRGWFFRHFARRRKI
jgi:glycosyltransferase involved in cell wall biosynthesis